MKASNPHWHHGWHEWRQILVGTWRAMNADHCSLIAAGCAFYGMGAFFPAVYTVVAIYGTLFDSSTFGNALLTVRELMPRQAYGMLQDWVKSVLYDEAHLAQTHLMISSVVMILSSMGGTRAVMKALNLALHETEKRHLLELISVAMALTLGGLLLSAFAFALIVGLPLALSLLGVPHTAVAAFRALGGLVALLCVLLGLSVIYRFGPSHKPPGWRLVSVGSLVATLIWGTASEAFGLYNLVMTHFGHNGSANATGPISIALVIMAWFYVLSYAVLLGGELNAQIDSRNKPVPPRAAICEPDQRVS